MSLEKYHKNVFELLQIFTNSFAVYGTALGSLREKQIIEHDGDSDIGIYSEHFQWSMVEEAIKQGYKVNAVFGMRYYGLEIAFVKDGFKTDLMLFYIDKQNHEKRFNCLWENGGRDGIKNAIVHEYDSKLLDPIDGKLGNYTIKTLGEEYIKNVYGENWRIPIKKWNWKTDHLCKKTG